MRKFQMVGDYHSVQMTTKEYEILQGLLCGEQRNAEIVEAERHEVGGHLHRIDMRLDALFDLWSNMRAKVEPPPKDLSDPYPLDGPNVRNQNAHDALSEWLRGVDKRLRVVENGPPITATIHPYWKTICDGMSERLEALELRVAQEIGGIDLLETRLTALSETVARNRAAHNMVADRTSDLEKRRIWGSVERRMSQRRRSGVNSGIWAGRGIGDGHRLNWGRRVCEDRRQP